MSARALNPYLNFDGNTRQAMEFYQSVLGGSLKVQTFGEIPGMQAAPGQEDKVVHALLEADGIVIMASDPAPGTSVKFGDNVSLNISGSDLEKLTAVFNGLSAGGKVTMPLAKQFWGDTFGMFTDKFGLNWMVNISGK
jgi:PhnB protein